MFNVTLELFSMVAQNLLLSPSFRDPGQDLIQMHQYFQQQPFQQADIQSENATANAQIPRATTASTVVGSHGLMPTSTASLKSQQGIALDVEQQFHQQQIVTDGERRHVIDEMLVRFMDPE
ncbi:hypothetical protein HDU76_000405 [Blyttiomyces sp. JEL0837]|nr:hypothetical protein HDU76_000405 [Blyttiomyces sp. JEL0837]